MHEWMLDAEQWKRIPTPYKGWNILAYYIVAVKDPKEVSEEQSDAFDYGFAAMLQKDTGWN
jgi:hypothetical protein